MDYSNIRNLAEIDEARAELQRRIRRSGDNLVKGVDDVRGLFRPANLLYTGIHKAWDWLPLGQMLLYGARKLGRRKHRK